MYYDENIVEDIRSSNDIVDIISSYVNLKQKGSSYFGLCPFHNESTPSFSVSSDKQLFHCFGCGASGNVYTFIMKIENLDFKEAINFLADKINYILPTNEGMDEYKKLSETKSIIYEIHKVSARYFYENLSKEEGLIAKKYLDSRIVSNKLRIKFGLGYSLKSWDSLYRYLTNKGYSLENILKSGLVIKSKDGRYFDRFRERLMFPIFDAQNRVIGFGGRTINKDEPKYLNSPETIIFNKSKNMYNINYAKNSKKEEFILVEGYMDTISLYEEGFFNTVGILGTSFNIEHAKSIKKYVNTVVIAFDNDDAGEKATIRAIKVLINNNIKVKVLHLENAKDPDEYIKKFGKTLFLDALKNSKNYMDFQIHTISKGLDLNNTDEKIEFTSRVVKLLSTLSSPIELDAYVSYISKITSISKEAIKEELKRYISNKDVEFDKKVLHKKKVNNKGLEEAKKNIIKILIDNFKYFNIISENLTPEEMEEDIYINLLQIIYNSYYKNEKISPAKLISYFENLDDQKTISNIFSTDLDLKDEKFIYQAINDYVKVIKKNHIEKKILDTSDMEKMQKLINIRRNIENLNISRLDG